MIRLLCVGLGGMGGNDWQEAVKTGRFEPVGGVDVVPEHREEFEKATGKPTFDNLDEALSVIEADAATVGTPDQFHAPFSIKAMEAGLDVICEKPMAESVEDARRMHETAEKNGRMLMIHHQLRWYPMYHHARRLITDGVIGDLRNIEFSMSVFSDVCLNGYRSTLPQLMLQDLGIHHFDLIRYLTGEECESIYVRSWTSLEDGLDIPASTNVYAIMEMTGPVTACYTSKMRALIDPIGYGSAATVTGSKGELIIKQDQMTLQTRDAHKKGEDPRQVDIEAPELDTWEAFAQAIETRKPALTASGDNLRSLEMLFAAIESVETGQIVRMEN